MSYGSCRLAYTFHIKDQTKGPYPGTVKVFSANPDYKGYWIDMQGDSDKRVRYVVLYNKYEDYKQSDHYIDIKNCEESNGGFVIDGSDYSKCPANFYCPDYKIKKPCPNRGKSSPGSASIGQCKRSK